MEECRWTAENELSHSSSVERDAGAADHRIIKGLKMPATAAAKQDASQAA
jgi:hypothetical protein